jgi:hypothetical protein
MQPGTRASGDPRWLGLSLREHLAALATFAVVTAVFFFPLARGETFSDVDRRQTQSYPWAGSVVGEPGPAPVHFDYDDSFYPWQVFMSRELRDARIPLWNPYSFGGAPFFANGQSGVLYPPRLVLSLTVSPTRTHDVLLLTHFYFAGVAMFLMLAFGGLSFAPSLVGGLAWMLNSFSLSWQMLEHFVAIEVWLPVAFLLTMALVRRRSWAAVFGLALVLALLFVGGNVLFVELAFAAALAWGLVLVVVEAFRDRGTLAGNVARVVTASVLSACLVAVVSWPTLDLASNSARASLGYDELGAFALPWDALVNVFRVPPLWAGDPYHINLFAGTAAATLAIVGVLRRAVLARFAAVLAGVTVLYMVHTPVTWVVAEILPGFDNFKPLGRAAFLLTFAISVLAAFGLDLLLRRSTSGRGAEVVASPFFGGAVVGGVVAAGTIYLARGDLRGSSSLVLAIGLAAAAALAVLLLPSVGRRLGRQWHRLASRLRIGLAPAVVFLIVASAASIVGQSYVLARHVMPHQPDDPDSLYPETPLIRFLERDPDARVLPTARMLVGSTAIVYPLRNSGGYESLLPRRIEDFWRVVGGDVEPENLADERLIYAYKPQFELARLQAELLARAAVDYVITPPESTEEPPPGFEEVYEGTDGRVLRVRGSSPEAVVVGRCVHASTPLDALEAFVDEGFDPGGAVVLEDVTAESCASSDPGTAGRARVVDRSANGVTVEVNATRSGWLVLSDSWYPAWRADIDGSAVDVLPGNYAQRAVPVTAGRHVVTFSYEPTGLENGAYISGAALLVCALGLTGVTWRSRRRRR